MRFLYAFLHTALYEFLRFDFFVEGLRVLVSEVWGLEAKSLGLGGLAVLGVWDAKDVFVD